MKIRISGYLRVLVRLTRGTVSVSLACAQKRLDGFLKECINGACRFGSLQQLKVAPRLVHVSGNLLAQGIDGGELNLIAQPLQKVDLYLGLRSQLYRMEIQQMCLDGKGFDSECWSLADVRHGVEAFLRNSRSSDINAISGN